MRLAWVGFHAEALPALDALLSAGAPIGGVLTLTSTLAANRSGGGDFKPVCERYGVPLHYVSDINAPDAQRVLRGLEPDVAFVIRWHPIVRAQTLCSAAVGLIEGAPARL